MLLNMIALATSHDDNYKKEARTRFAPSSPCQPRGACASPLAPF